MSSPNGEVPAGGASGTGLEALLNTDQAAWEAQQADKLSKGHQNAQTNFASRFLANLAAAGAAVVQGIGNFISDFLGTLFGGYSGSDPQMVEVQTFFENQGTIISDKAYYAEIPASAPMWGSANPLEDCTFPRVLLNRFAKPEVRASSPPHRREYRSGSFNADVDTTVPLRTSNFSGSAVNSVRFGLIRSDRSRTYSTVSVMLGVKKSENPVYVGVYRMDMVTGDFHAHCLSPNITPTVTTQQSEVRLSFPPVITQKADIWAVALLQTGSNNITAVREWANVISEYVEAPPLTYPPRQHARLLDYTTLPETATRTALDFTGNEYGLRDYYAETIIFASLGETPNPEDQFGAKYAETFGSRLGSWATIGPEFGMPGGYVTHHRTADGQAGALWVSPTGTDDMVVEGRQATKTKHWILGEEQGPPTGRWQRLIARCSPDFRTGTACEWTNSTVRVITWNTDYPNSGNSYSTAGSVAHPVTGGDRVRFAVQGSTGRVWVNDLLVLTCTVSTPTGARYRHVGFGTSRYDWTSSGGLSAWSAADIEE